MLLRSPKDAAAGAGAAAAGVVTVVLVALLFAPQVVANNNGVIPLPIYGYGRFPCTKEVDGCLKPDQSKCDAIAAGFECVQQKNSTYFFCGIAGAACPSGVCDGGQCVNGKCVGGLGDPVSPDGHCMSLLGLGTDHLCGGEWASCALPIRQYELQPLNDQYNQLCVSNFCSRGANGVNQCREFVTQEGGDCTFDPERACANGLVPTYNQETHQFTCEKPPPPPSPPPPSYPSHRVRVRARRKHDSRCPPSYTACPLGDSYECIDILNNLEQCGGCNADDGGVDCTTLRGVAGVGCVAGRCEIWTCEDGYDFVSPSGICVPRTT
ncbi:hypothetical protein RHOSPDRAFT_36873 [Rhodotorula sp. JG-1b]|nr:hypothetical protein RHOSPDRAFT_36873 [Rhodotorula sp. JG-1b]